MRIKTVMNHDTPCLTHRAWHRVTLSDSFKIASFPYSCHQNVVP